jgi:hypothetical protein
VRPVARRGPQRASMVRPERATGGTGRARCTSISVARGKIYSQMAYSHALYVPLLAFFTWFLFLDYVAFLLEIVELEFFSPMNCYSPLPNHLEAAAMTH